MSITENISELITEINFLHNYQNSDGSFIISTEYDFYATIDQIKRLASTIYDFYNMEYMIEPLHQDLDNWLVHGIDTKPFFDNTLEAFISPHNNQKVFLFAPIQTPNGPHEKKGFYLEAFLAKRSEPKELEYIKKNYPHPKDECVSLKVNFATTGFMENNCIVIFPENILTKNKVDSQKFAMFFYNKFFDIYHKETLKIVDSNINYENLYSRNLTRDETYIARSLWGYLHDLYHHKGSKPFHLNLYTKINFWVGIVEEIKVDCQTILTLYKDDLIFSKEILEFILFERILRYPNQHDFNNNFDSATGLFLTSWLCQNGDVFTKDESNKVNINYENFIKSITLLVDEIEKLELITNDDEFKELTIEFLTSYLEIDQSTKKVEIPYCYKYLFNTKQKGSKSYEHV